MEDFDRSFKEAVRRVERDDKLSDKKAKNLEELRKSLNIGQVWWDEVLKDMFLTPEFRKVLDSMKKREVDGEDIYPTLVNIFSWTRIPGCEPDKIKVLIVGQDPIANHDATGISFLLRPDAEYDCPSIEYIFDSVKNNFPDEFEGKTIAHGPKKDREDATHQCPYGWATEGVLLLNNLMTIGGWGQENRHVTDGWEVATMMILEHFIRKKGYNEVLVWGSYWMTGDLIWEDDTGSKWGNENCPFKQLEKLAEGNEAMIRYNCHPNAGKKDPDTGKKTDFIEDTTTLFSDVNKALEEHGVGGVAWHTIIPYPDIPDGVIASVDVVEQLAKKLESASLEQKEE